MEVAKGGKTGVVMKICYIVYREENVLVYVSQVLEYLQHLKNHFDVIEDIELIVFRHEENLFKRVDVEDRIHRYIDKCKTFWTMPVLTLLQLKINAQRLKRYIMKKYSPEDHIAVICRGDLAGYVGSKAFRKIPSSRILFDNRGLAFEESVMSYKNNPIHQVNRIVKRKALQYTKSHCDMYNFVTQSMRDYFIKQYGYNAHLPFTIIPTLYRGDKLDYDYLDKIQIREHYKKNDYIVSYVGSSAAWQSTERLVDIVKTIGNTYPEVRFFILSKGEIPEFKQLSEEMQSRITIKSVPHKEMKYYLHLTNLGIVIRDNNIVNQVAAPTKIAEYLTSGVGVLYSGKIGIIRDLERVTDGSQLIDLDTDMLWLDKIGQDIKKRKKYVNPRIASYFDMDARQKETVAMLNNSFDNKKVK